MNDEQRAALVEELAAAIRPGVRYAVELNGERRDKIDEQIAWGIADPQIPDIVDDLMPIIDRLLAEREPTVPLDAERVERAANGDDDDEL